MTERPSSGNRWEPSETQPIAATPAPTPAPVVPPPATTPAPHPSGTGWRRWPASVWTAIVAVGVAAFLASGIAGYAVGRASQRSEVPATSVFGPGQGRGQDQGPDRGQDPNQGQGFGTQP